MSVGAVRLGGEPGAAVRDGTGEVAVPQSKLNLFEHPHCARL